MPSSTPQGDHFISSRQRRIRHMFGVTTGLLVAATLFAGAQATGPQIDRPYLMPEANRLPDKNAQAAMQQQAQQDKRTNYSAANLERKRQIADDAAKLLALATELKKEVDKTDKDTLSIDVIRKAETIEKLAKGVKEKMKLTAGAS